MAGKRQLGSHQEQDPASSDEEALNEILAQRESLKRQSSETLTASEAPPLPPPVPPRVQEVAQRAAHSTRTASEALPLPHPILPHCLSSVLPVLSRLLSESVLCAPFFTALGFILEIRLSRLVAVTA